MIGEGAMGRVYAAVDPVLERKIALTVQAAVLIRLQRPREALPLARLAVKKEQQLGSVRQEQEAMQTLGLALIGVEDFAAGHAQLEALRARITERSGADHNDITQTLDLEGQALMEHGKYALALPLVIESARRRHAEGTDPCAECYSYSLWGQCQLALGNQVEGRAHLRRAVALLETAEPLSTVALAEAREKLAKSTKAP